MGEQNGLLTNDEYQAIGRFVTNCGFVDLLCRHLYSRLISKKGKAARNAQRNLRDFGGLLRDLKEKVRTSSEGTEKAEISSFLDEVGRLYKHRNEIVHSNWEIRDGVLIGREFKKDTEPVEYRVESPRIS